MTSVAPIMAIKSVGFSPCQSSDASNLRDLARSPFSVIPFGDPTLRLPLPFFLSFPSAESASSSALALFFFLSFLKGICRSHPPHQQQSGCPTFATSLFFRGSQRQVFVVGVVAAKVGFRSPNRRSISSGKARTGGSRGIHAPEPAHLTLPTRSLDGSERLCLYLPTSHNGVYQE